ncbi:Glycosyltransferase involved in cell wall bisynthesis [Flavobacterium glycines]|uniref:Glycosyl transferase family 1 n=1 Tax=Flavobacterium glycines TaxID=551990 RepID=A0A1B9DHB8_9FLAO|nr:glycosyltransferase family 4 protein [Flavobacterium glycines]OCB69077.1 glycosyl transferase family 1 [Flavobacterium glycines]GEL11996.1 glycosyl transferase family 1 [Flavobacterium glycines]SDJ53919.1 Glycosyltransferase involved in cell wall bisynthesis [Flavobacterium glycines]
MLQPKLIRTSTVAMSLDFLLKGQLAFLSGHFEVVAVSGDDEHLKRLAEREQVRTVPLQMQRNISPLKDLLSLWKLYLLFKKEKPQIVHSITPKAGLLSMIAGKMAGVPVRIHTFTGLIFPSKTGLLQKILILMDKVLCCCATHIYPEGHGVKNDLIQYKITSKPLKVIANGNVNGIDTAYFSKEKVSVQEQQALKKELCIGENDFVFIFVGRLVGDKGINELVNAFKHLVVSSSAVENQSVVENESIVVNNRQITTDNSQPTAHCHPEPVEGSNLKLLLVGPLETELDPLQTETLKEIENNPNIISVGFQKDVRSYFSISDCLVFPSYREGFPNVVLQAGAMGLPAIVTDINGSNEIIVDGDNGIIISVKNSNSLLEAMNKIMKDSQFYSQLQMNARPMIVSRYEQKVVWEGILNEYKKLEKSV